MIKSNIMLTILSNVVKDTETNPEVFEPSALNDTGGSQPH